ncbi:hypothetical protein DFS34DRAFT_616431 [Phlyctochytrium arcticum]|nr:hypothetical protein DFS34DRAFT_616431 [Phlyctochytrium arcticum]
MPVPQAFSVVLTAKVIFSYLDFKAYTRLTLTCQTLYSLRSPHDIRQVLCNTLGGAPFLRLIGTTISRFLDRHVSPPFPLEFRRKFVMSRLEETAAEQAEFQAPPPSERLWLDVDIFLLLQHDLDSCAEFALAHWVKKSQSVYHSAHCLTSNCLSRKISILGLELLARYNKLDSNYGLFRAVQDIQDQSGPVYFDFFWERCTSTDHHLWGHIESVEMAEKLIGKTTVTTEILAMATRSPQVFRFLLSHLPDPVPAFDSYYGDWYLPALKAAVKNGHVETLKVLLAREDVNVNAMTPDDEEYSILATSLLRGTTAMADFLLSNGALVSKPDVLFDAIDGGIPVEYIENTLIQKHGAQPFANHAIYALQEESFDVLAMLLRHLKTASPPFTLEEMETQIGESRPDLLPSLEDFRDFERTAFGLGKDSDL